MEKEFVTITQKRYEELLQTERFMRALEVSGVDNWDGYDFAVDILDQEDN